MQKYLWGGAALIVAGAASVYVASDYFLRHPESVIARAGNALGTAAAYSNPLSVINRTTSGTDVARQDGAEVAQVNIVKPVLADDGDETIEPIQVEAVPSGTFVPPEAGGTEESEWQAHQEGECDPPKPMPYAEVDPSEQFMGCPIQQLLDAMLKVGTDSKEDVEAPMGYDVEPIYEMPQEAMSEGEGAGEAEENLDMPMPEETVEPSYYHHHSDGCPYMGGCPYPHSTPPQSPVEIPAGTKPVKIKKTNKTEANSYWNDLLKRTSERRTFNAPLLDTMEFRPSDAGRYPVSKTGPF
jgi:hypothetical protein